GLDERRHLVADAGGVLGHGRGTAGRDVVAADVVGPGIAHLVAAGLLLRALLLQHGLRRRAALRAVEEPLPLAGGGLRDVVAEISVRLVTQLLGLGRAE